MSGQGLGHRGGLQVDWGHLGSNLGNFGVESNILTNSQSCPKRGTVISTWSVSHL